MFIYFVFASMELEIKLARKNDVKKKLGSILALMVVIILEFTTN